MMVRKFAWTALAGALVLLSGPLWGTEVSVEGGPVETGFNSGTFALIHATVHGIAGLPKRYVVFAEIQYYGTTSAASVEMDRLPQTKPGVEEFHVGWPIPPQAPTGFYTLTLHVDDRIDHTPEITRKVHGFVVYKKLARISRVTLDKAAYSVGDPIKCEVRLENLTDSDLKNVRVEFSNALYPWIPIYFQGGRDNPEWGVKTLQERVDIPAGTALTVPMTVVGTASLPPAKSEAAAGPGSSPGHEEGSSPNLRAFAVTLWSADHSLLYDLQFSSQVTVQAVGQDLSNSPGGNPARSTESPLTPPAAEPHGVSPANPGEASAASHPHGPLLVICAHEGDEQRFAGMILAALHAKNPVHVLILNAGDGGECVPGAAKPCEPDDARAFSEARMEESAKALEHLGLAPEQVMILGLPDGGLGAIWYRHKDPLHPFLPFDLACDRAPFPNVYKPNLPYASTTVVDAIRQIITDLHPATITLPPPDARQMDRRVAGWFVLKACQELVKSKELDPQTIVLASQAFATDNAIAAPFQYETFVVPVSSDAWAQIQGMAPFYKTLDAVQSGNEHHGTANPLTEEMYHRLMDWQDHEGWNEKAMN